LLVVNQLAVLEEVKVYRAPSKVDGVHCITAARLDVDGLLFRCAGKLATSDHKSAVCSKLNQLAHIQQESCLLLTKTHTRPFFEQLNQCKLRLLLRPY